MPYYNIRARAEKSPGNVGKKFFDSPRHFVSVTAIAPIGIEAQYNISLEVAVKETVASQLETWQKRTDITQMFLQAENSSAKTDATADNRSRRPRRFAGFNARQTRCDARSQTVHAVNKIDGAGQTQNSNQS
jgi:hypothetical protein